MVEPYPRSSPVVLLTENDAIIGLDLQDELERAGFDTAGPFLSCVDATAWLQKHTPDCAILDIHLRDGVCNELARELTRRAVPFAVYSGELQAKASPDFDSAVWIDKPAQGGRLLDVVLRMLREPERRHG